MDGNGDLIRDIRFLNLGILIPEPIVSALEEQVCSGDCVACGYKCEGSGGDYDMQ